MNFGRLEKVSSTLLNPAKNFTIKNVVVLGSKDVKTKSKRDAITEKSYPSSKYAEYSELNSVR